MLHNESLSKGAASVSEYARARLFATPMKKEDVRPLLNRLDDSLRSVGHALNAVYSLASPPPATRIGSTQDQVSMPEPATRVDQKSESEAPPADSPDARKE